MKKPLRKRRNRWSERTRHVRAATHAFTEGEWSIVQAVADGLEWSYGWVPAAAQRLRFVIDFAYATGVRSSELVGATLGMIEEDAQGGRWLHMTGKGHKAGKVALPPMARAALDRYLAQRRLPTTLARWDPATPLLGSLEQESAAGITGPRLWAVMKRFFSLAADAIAEENPATADKLRRASLATTSIYLHTDEDRRARQLGEAFGKVRR